jgi:transcriptional regulator with XRE-family HTH domain
MKEKELSRIVLKVRRKLRVSQEGLSRLVNATKGAVQHWERGRNKPDLARLLALRQLCTAGPERKELDRLIRGMQSQVSPVSLGAMAQKLRPALSAHSGRLPQRYPAEVLATLRHEQRQLRRQTMRLEHAIARTNDQIKALATVVRQLQRGFLKLRSGLTAEIPTRR